MYPACPAVRMRPTNGFIENFCLSEHALAGFGKGCAKKIKTKTAESAEFALGFWMPFRQNDEPRVGSGQENSW